MFVQAAWSLYNEGMQPVHYSVVGSKLTGVGWNRRGHNIKYFKTTLKRCVCVIRFVLLCLLLAHGYFG